MSFPESSASAFECSKRMHGSILRRGRPWRRRGRQWTSWALNIRTRSSNRISLYSNAFQQQNIVAIAYPTMPFPAPLLPTEGDAVTPTFEVGGRQYPDTAILRNALPGPAFRAPALSIPVGLTRDGLPVGFEIDGLPGGDNQLLRLGMAIEGVLEPLPPPTFRNG